MPEETNPQTQPVPDVQPQEAVQPAPEVQSATPPQQDAALAPAAASGPSKTVLIVEDEKPLSHALEMKLKHSGYEAVVVSNGADAVKEFADVSKYQMMLLDLIMPNMDGFAVLQELQKKGVSIPVIVLSNLGQEEDKKKAKELGAVEYFVKSNTPISQIIDTVKKTLS